VRGVHHVLRLMLWRPRGRTKLTSEDKQGSKNNQLNCHLVRNWFQKQQLVFSICGVPRHTLCPLTNEREVAIGIPVDLIDLSDLIKERGGEAFTFFPVVGCLTK